MPVKGPNHLLLLFLAVSDLLCGLWAVGNILALNLRWTPLRIVCIFFSFFLGALLKGTVSRKITGVKSGIN